MIIIFALLATLAAIPSGNTSGTKQGDTLLSLTDGTDFGRGTYNDIVIEEFYIPTPKPIHKTRKGKTAFGKDCFCFKENNDTYPPSIKDEDCICKKICCKVIPAYLPPPDGCEICPKCYCNTTTYTLVNKESGRCPSCKPPPEKKCECRYGKYVNKEKGNCPSLCDPLPCKCVLGRYVNKDSGNCPVPCLPPPPPPCRCFNGRYINEKSGNCPVPCKPLPPPPCRCINGRYFNEISGNCPVICKPNCSCDKKTGKLINKGTGICPTYCPYRYNKPLSNETLSIDFQ